MRASKTGAVFLKINLLIVALEIRAVLSDDQPTE